LVEYKTEAFNMFERLMGAIDSEIVHRIFKIAVATPEQIHQMQAITNATQIENQESSIKNQGAPITDSKPLIQGKRPGRNDPCYCGSGKKYKKCHLNSNLGR
jgi:preprotein translocase subunit SecA